MSELLFTARAPSNIALIKYMGKKDASANLPENGSLSMTLNSLCSVAQISVSESGSGISWVPEVPRKVQFPSLHVPDLKESGVQKLVRHAERVSTAVKEIFPSFGLELRSASEGWVFRTANTFPQGSGIASSASSFAAMTLASAMACARNLQTFEKAWQVEPSLRTALARVSRLGSGSSCRSLDGPWVFWEDEAVSVLPSSMPKMAHFVILVSEQEKKVSSSEAHLRVKTSPLWEGRVHRVAQRLEKMKAALTTGDLKTVALTAWSESWEMHSLFHTSSEPFTYWEPATMTALQELSGFMKDPVPPIVTLDAGPNVHVIVPAAQAELWYERLSRIFPKVLRDGQGTGGIPLELPGVMR
jgi:diphosphomevalonate decarboxylase